jgi:hypothetical protein
MEHLASAQTVIEVTMDLEELVKKITESRQHCHVYHFTDECNFPLIKKHGLLSKNRMRELEIWPEAPSGN